VSDYVNSLPPRASIITGSASGVDAAATKAARAKGMAVQVMPASFDELADNAKSAARNQRLVDACDVLVAFWDGSSKGTRATVERALDSGKEVHVFLPSPGPRGTHP
jgi:NADP-dependent 3-hydroxy acid dehydrogenase YdfG